jgi:hypothetical protein
MSVCLSVCLSRYLLLCSFPSFFVSIFCRLFLLSFINSLFFHLRSLSSCFLRLLRFSVPVSMSQSTITCRFISAKANSSNRALNKEAQCS